MHANIFRSVIVIILFYTALFAQSLSTYFHKYCDLTFL